MSAQASRLTQVLDTARNSGADLAIIDTAPHSESTSLAAARAADLILIPCRPAILDLRAIGQTIELARLAGTTVGRRAQFSPGQGNAGERSGGCR